MAQAPIGKTLAASKAVVLGGMAAIGLASLLTIGADRNATGSAVIGSTPAIAQAAAPAPAPSAPIQSSFSPDQVKALHAIIKDYLISNPEIMIDVTRELERKQAAEQEAKQRKFMADNKADIFKSAGDFVLGNPKGDITVIEFFDYNCGWCKRAVDDLVKLTKADPRVRVVMKEYPIFGGPDSVLAAKAATAAIKQNKYWEFHTALMREKQVTAANVFTVAQRVGLDVNRLKTDMADPKVERLIQGNIKIGQELGIEGTPGFVLDSRVNVGYVNADGMQKILAEIRKEGCKIC
jgi:protein-disulfide isomerase